MPQLRTLSRSLVHSRRPSRHQLTFEDVTGFVLVAEREHPDVTLRLRGEPRGLDGEGGIAEGLAARATEDDAGETIDVPD